MDEKTKVKGKSLQEWKLLYRQYSDQWQRIHDYGDGDQMWADGITLNQIRRELLNVQEVLFSYEENAAIPQEMPENYVAAAERIRKVASDNLEKYLQSEDYRYLCRMGGQLTGAQKKRTQISFALGRIRGLKLTSDQDDLVVLREFGMEGQFERLLADTAERVRKLPKGKKTGIKDCEDWQVEGQMSIFDLAS